MKIQHIRRDKKLVGTIVAVKNEAKGVVHLNSLSTLVPKKIEPEFREFVNHISSRKEFDGFHTPLPDDFIYTYNSTGFNVEDLVKLR